MAVPNPVMLVMGDSVMWGQGLDDDNKFSSLAYDQLSYKYPDLQGPVMLAHSGAKIGNGDTSTWPALPGEVPASGPTILDQCDQYADPSSVRVILIDGGINDVDIRLFLNPTTTPASLECRIIQYCHDDMKVLLQKVAKRFSHPDCKIVVLGYFPILSKNSNPLCVPALLKARGIDNADELMLSAAAVSDPRDLAIQFWQQSDSNLRAAVKDAGDSRITYVLPPFQEQNALFESDPCLWGLDILAGLAPEDQVVDQRREECVRLVPAPLDCQECIRASVGHPNATGALKYCEAVMSAFP